MTQLAIMNVPPGNRHPHQAKRPQRFQSPPPPPPSPSQPNGTMRLHGTASDPPPPSMNGFIYDPETRLPLRAPPGFPFPLVFNLQDTGAAMRLANYPMHIDPTPPIPSLIDVTPTAVAASELCAQGTVDYPCREHELVQTDPLCASTAMTISAPAPLVASRPAESTRFDFIVDPPCACMVEHCIHPTFCELAPCGCKICREHLGSIIRSSRFVGTDEQGRRTKLFKCLACQTDSFTIGAMGQNGEQGDEIEQGQQQPRIQHEDSSSMFSIHYTLPTHSVPMAMTKPFPPPPFGFPVDPSWLPVPLPQIPSFSPEMNQGYDATLSGNALNGTISGGYGDVAAGPQQQQQQHNTPPPRPPGFPFPIVPHGLVFPVAQTTQGFSPPMPPPYILSAFGAPPSYSMPPSIMMPMIPFDQTSAHYAGPGGDGPRSKPFNRSFQGAGEGPTSRFRSGGSRKGFFRHGRASSLPQSSLLPIPGGRSNSGAPGGHQVGFERENKMVPSPLLMTSIRPMPRGSYGGHVAFSRRSIDESALRRNGATSTADGVGSTSVEARSAWRVHKPAFPIIKIENLPFATTVRDVENWLPEGTLAPKDNPKLLLAVHLILHRDTGRTLPHAYVEMKSIQIANEVMTQMDRKLLGDRTVRVKWERRGELMRDLFSQEGYFVTPAPSPAASALPPVPSHYVLPQTILTRKDVEKLVRHAEDGRESRERPLERAFLNVVTILAKFPWSELDLYTQQQRDAIFDCAYDVTVLAARKAQVDPDRFASIYELLKRASVKCLGFTVEQREEVRALDDENLPPEGSRRTPVLARPPSPTSHVKPHRRAFVGPPASPPKYRSEQRQGAGSSENETSVASGAGEGWVTIEENRRSSGLATSQPLESRLMSTSLPAQADSWATNNQSLHTPPPTPPLESKIEQREQKKSSIVEWAKTLPKVEPARQGSPVTRAQDEPMGITS
ncbi:BQ5605_C003g02547 [Microbotryum silenes-dioicae]|uniref:BQ5605_C003g02547 protein n=1 Tax=Microbotryum silenes-dioicae TaxID=796604 RepID=A0A2X0MP54_9BASI|nr:BQ5605_C003g02547 [Microbotryum silenes-dioicae]